MPDGGIAVDYGTGDTTVSVPIYDPESGEYLGAVQQSAADAALRQQVGEAYLMPAVYYPNWYVSTTAANNSTTLSAADMTNALQRFTANTTAISNSFVQLSQAAGAAATSWKQFYTRTNMWTTGATDEWTRTWPAATAYYSDTTFQPRTPEQIAAAQRKARRAEIKRRAATKRAMVLLKTHLPDDAAEQLERDGYFEVVSLTSGRRYRVYGNSYSRNVVELDATGTPIARLCAHGGYGSVMPLQDHLLAQKLYLENCEDQFRKIANISRIGTVEAAELLGRPNPAIAKYQQILAQPIAA